MPRGPCDAEGSLQRRNESGDEQRGQALQERATLKCTGRGCSAEESLPRRVGIAVQGGVRQRGGVLRSERAPALTVGGAAARKGVTQQKAVAVGGRRDGGTAGDVSRCGAIAATGIAAGYRGGAPAAPGTARGGEGSRGAAPRGAIKAAEGAGAAAAAARSGAEVPR